MSKFTLILLFATLVCLGASLKCYKCGSSKESCENASSDDCKNNENYCVAAVAPKLKAYFKGCWSDGKVCDTKDSNGNKAYPECQVCDSDNCNSMKF